MIITTNPSSLSLGRRLTAHLLLCSMFFHAKATPPIGTRTKDGIGSRHEEVGLDVQMNLIAPEDVEKFREHHPDISLTALEKNILHDEGKLHYSFDSPNEGDKRVTFGFHKHEWEEPQDIQLVITYPIGGEEGAYNISHVNILVDQSSNQGRAYITSGGIGKKSITIYVDIFRSLYLGYEIQIFGAVEK